MVKMRKFPIELEDETTKLLDVYAKNDPSIRTRTALIARIVDDWLDNHPEVRA